MVRLAVLRRMTAMSRRSRSAAKNRMQASFAKLLGVFRRVVKSEGAVFIARAAARIVTAERLNQPRLRRSAFIWRRTKSAIGFLHSFFKQFARQNPDAFSFICALRAEAFRLNRDGASALPRAFVRAGRRVVFRRAV